MADDPPSPEDGDSASTPDRNVDSNIASVATGRAVIPARSEARAAAPNALNSSQVRNSYRASTVSIPRRIANNSNRTNKKNYSIAKLECLNECVAAVLPLSGAEWEMVSHSHCVYYPGRTWESLRKKFNEVARKSIPTGDPNCPPYV